jgi:hypothetical protein
LTATPPPSAFAVDSTCQSGGTRIAIPPHSVLSVSRASGASVAFRRSTAMPPNHVNIEPPRNAGRAALELDPVEDRDKGDLVALRVATGGEDALHESRRPEQPGQKPSLKTISERNSRTGSSVPAVTTMAAWTQRPSASCSRPHSPGAASVDVEDRTGGGDHFQVTVVSDAFDGLRSSTSTVA